MKSFIFSILMALSLVASFSPSVVKKELKLCRLFSDHMVLQQQAEVSFWGEATAGQQVMIAGSWGKKASAKTDVNGNWKIKLGTTNAGGPYTITIKSADSTIVIKDVLLGEVWLASGQSNMDLPVKGWPPVDTVFNSAQEIAEANYPDIRLLKVPFNISATPLDSIGGQWMAASPKTAGDFSATAYFYARKLYHELHVPIGIIQSSIGGTPAEAWTSSAFLAKFGDFDKTMDGLQKLQTSSEDWFKKWHSQQVPKTDEQWKNIQFGDLAAAELNFDDSQWPTTKLPGRFDRLSSGEFDGAIWLRKEFVIDDTTTGYILKIAAIDDMEAIYINGQKVGGFIGAGFAGTAREIIIPKSLLVKGRNIIAIRAIDSGGAGFFRGPMNLSDNKGNMVSLEGDWKSHLIAEILKGKFYTYDLKTNISERPDISKLNSNSPTVLFNAMIHPLVPYTIKGAIWYQGESNVGRAEQYKRLFPLMIEDWREKWGYNFPFYFVQLAPYLYTAPDQKDQSQKLRNAQRYALNLPKTGMAVTLDIGKLATAHPAFKQKVGERLTRFALANEYRKNMVSSGPLFKKANVSGNEIVIEFASVGSGLISSDKGLYGFEIAGADKMYVQAQAKIVKDKVVVSNPSVAAPLYVRYAWSDGAGAGLFNKEGLPASTFTSEDE